MADRTLAVIRQILNWHATRSDDFRSPIVRGMARVKPKERERTLSDDELRVIWKVAGEGEGPFPALTKFLLLTASRRSEGAEITVGEVDGADWTLPAARNKTKVDLVRPLSDAARAVLEKRSLVDGRCYYFTTDGKRPISAFSKFKQKFDATVLAELRKQDPEAKPLRNWTLHDLRRTARSLMSRAGVNVDHAERCLGHVMGGVRGTYDRHEYHPEKKKAYEALATMIERIVNSSVGNVVQFDSGRGWDARSEA
jgi:integrase